MPLGTARRVGGGYEVNGSWPYASGSQHADWAMVSAKTVGNEAEEGICMLFAPIGVSGFAIENTWHVTGMRGSSSNSLAAKQTFVSEDCVLAGDWAKAIGTSVEDADPRDNWPFATVGGLYLIPPVLGAARKLLDLVVANAGKKGVMHWDYPRQVSSHVVLHQIGESAIEIDTALQMVLQAADAVDTTAQQRRLTRTEQVRFQAAQGFAMQLVRTAADRLMSVAGSSGFAASSALQRAWRDIAVGSRHAFLNSDQSFELYGRELTGEPLQSPYFKDLPN
jgi:alkylation response protein AidB-like acyl-CoA dehydrogenase